MEFQVSTPDGVHCALKSRTLREGPDRGQKHIPETTSAQRTRTPLLGAALGPRGAWTRTRVPNHAHPRVSPRSWRGRGPRPPSHAVCVFAGACPAPGDASGAAWRTPASGAASARWRWMRWGGACTGA